MTKSVPGKTPFEAATGHKPDLSTIHKWGSVIWVHGPSGSKLNPHAREGHWIGIDEQSKGVRVYWPSHRAVTIERNIYFTPPQSPEFKGEEEGYIPVSEFDEFELPSTSAAPPPAPPAPPAPAPFVLPAPRPVEPAPVHPVAPVAPVPPPVVSVPTRQSQHTHAPSQAVREVFTGRAEGYVPGGLPESTEGVSSQGEQGEEVGHTTDDEDNAKVKVTVSAIEADEDMLEYALAAEVSDVEALEPHTLVEAHAHSDWLLWEKVIHEELDTLHTTSTWVFEEPPAGANVVGSNFKVKKDAMGKVVCYKAHLVA